MIVFKYPYRHWSPCWESVKAPYHIFRLLTQFINHMEVHFLDVYTPNEEEKKDPRLFAENVRNEMAKKAGLGKAEASFSDKVKYLKSIRGDKI